MSTVMNKAPEGMCNIVTIFAEESTTALFQPLILVFK